MKQIKWKPILKAVGLTMLLPAFITVFLTGVGILMHLSEVDDREAGKYIAQTCVKTDRDCLAYCDMHSPYNGTTSCIMEIKRLREQNNDKDT